MHTQRLFWGEGSKGEHGVLALVIGDDEFFDETAKYWIVPETQGAFPTIAANTIVTYSWNGFGNFQGISIWKVWTMKRRRLSATEMADFSAILPRPD